MDLSNNKNSDKVASPTQKHLTTKQNTSKVSETTVPTKESFQTPEAMTDLPESEGNVTAVVAKVKYTATEGQTCRKNEHPDRCCTSNNSSECY